MKSGKDKIYFALKQDVSSPYDHNYHYREEKSPDGTMAPKQSFTHDGAEISDYPDEQEQRMKRAEILRFRELYDLAPIGFVTLDQNHIIKELNAAASQFIAEEKALLRGSPFLNYVKKEYLDRYIQHCLHVSQTGEKSGCEVELVKKDGENLPSAIELHSLDNRKNDGNPCLLLVLSDISACFETEMRLQEATTALKAVLKAREEDRIEMERNVVSNIRKLVIPYLEKFKQSRLKEDQLQYLQLIQTNIENVIAPFLQSLSIKYGDLTPREFEIANLVKDGYMTKEIASMLFISPRSVEFHKDNIRKKMGLTNKKMNLQSYLTTLERSSA